MNIDFTSDNKRSGCDEVKIVTLTFTNFQLIIKSNGDHEIKPLVSDDAEFSDDTRKSVTHRSHLVTGELLAGAQYQEDYEQLGYPLQDNFTQRFANVEHAALHLWIDEMQADEFIAARPTEKIANALLKIALADKFEAAGLTGEEIEDRFVTGVQLLANGIQPAKDITFATTTSAGDVLDLKAPLAVLSSMSFINSLRGYLRQEFGG